MWGEQSGGTTMYHCLTSLEAPAVGTLPHLPNPHLLIPGSIRDLLHAPGNSLSVSEPQFLHL